MSQPDLSEAIPEGIWHYLQDADIRARDREYRESQQAAFIALLDKLDCG